MNENLKPLVSVCCLAYNHEKTIAEAIESVLSQVAPFRFEFIIHDDASTDSTAEIIRDYAKRYPDIIKPILQTENKYNECNLAKEYLFPNVSEFSKYIAICEGDDYWTDKNKLAAQVAAMEENPSRTMCFHAVTQLNSDGSTMMYRPLKKDGVVSTELIIKRGGMFCPSVSLMFRRDIADLWPEFRLMADVYDYPSQVLAAVSGEVYYIDRVMGVYRFASDNSWTAEHASSADRHHINNETAWLNEFNKYTEGRFSYAVDYHLAHLWFTEYRKNADNSAKTECRKYKNKLNICDRILFSSLLVFFSVFGRAANKVLMSLKKRLLR